MKESEIIKNGNYGAENRVFPDYCYVIILKFLELEDIFKKVRYLNKRIRNIVLDENYILYK